MRDIERTLRQAIWKKDEEKEAAIRLKEVEQEAALPAINYDRIGSSSRGSASSPVERHVIRVVDACEDLARATFRHLDAMTAAADLVEFLDDPTDLDIMNELFIRCKSPREAADRLGLSYKTILNRKAAALDRLEELVQTEPYAAKLAEKLDHMDDLDDTEEQNGPADP